MSDKKVTTKTQLKESMTRARNFCDQSIGELATAVTEAIEELDNKFVSNEEQSFTSEEKEQARNNIDAANKEHIHAIADVTNLQPSLDAKAAKADIAATKMAGFSNSAAIYVKISDFGAWGTGNWTQKGFSMLLTSRGGEMVWLALAADDSNTNAKAIRLLNTYSKITNIYYVEAESAIYVKMNAWCNNICAHVISNVNGDYVPAVAQASALPSGAVEIKITEFGATSAGVTVGGSNGTLSLAGSGSRPTYNGSNVALQSDIPSLSNYALKSDIPSLSNYALKTWVQQQIAAIAVYNGSVS